MCVCVVIKENKKEKKHFQRTRIFISIEKDKKKVGKVPP